MNKKSWQGIGASAGLAAGRIWLLGPAAGATAETAAADPGLIDSPSQLARLQQAMVMTNGALLQLEDQVRREQGEELAQIFAAHRLLLSDPAFTGEMALRIQDKGLPAEQAVQQVTTEAVTLLAALEDAYFRERAVDIQDVSQQLLQHLHGQGTGASRFPPAGSWVVMAEELTPAQTITLPKDRVAAFIVRNGGKTSHAAILARTYGIPAVVGVTAGWEELTGVEAVELDGEQGWIGALALADLAALPGAAGKPAESTPAEPAPAYTAITLAANIGNPSDLALVRRFQAQGVGLYRTEFLFMGTALPTEAEQAAAYTGVISACAPQLTVIRTLDIGGDKRAPALALPAEKNPFLGVRALRLCFNRPELFAAQLRAIWRASAAGPAAVMFPMIATLEELRQAKQYLETAREAVVSQGYPVGSLQVGMMIEVPAAVWLAAKLASEVDFFSIGTNDLIQYAVAVDRENSAVAHLYQAYHPAVLGMIAQVVRAGRAAGIWTGICGEAGGDPVLAPFFAGLGIDELSMSPGLLPEMRQALAGLDQDKIAGEGFVEKILACATAAEVTDLLTGYTK
ncbi:phosphoenolpyruvate--protein phosphotransferase [Sporomusa termitida]|uniref:Phosphoenolpyruvate-protein phosphotransferase n=1 Tax=Sporomusa termitida TaxID=2377 RepID=A0A517DYY0_9FIRM|nr:phosphoenolpyruvate--protein phosphotransferase [Sporomusa termitida]QDR82553.1 Phosphoenolpyruvate-protein phosphotransferase [Sporomusa termitida]